MFLIVFYTVYFMLLQLPVNIFEHKLLIYKLEYSHNVLSNNLYASNNHKKEVIRQILTNFPIQTLNTTKNIRWNNPTYFEAVKRHLNSRHSFAFAFTVDVAAVAASQLWQFALFHLASLVHLSVCLLIRFVRKFVKNLT